MASICLGLNVLRLKLYPPSTCNQVTMMSLNYTLIQVVQTVIPAFPNKSLHKLLTLTDYALEEIVNISKFHDKMLQSRISSVIHDVYDLYKSATLEVPCNMQFPLQCPYRGHNSIHQQVCFFKINLKVTPRKISKVLNSRSVWSSFHIQAVSDVERVLETAPI